MDRIRRTVHPLLSAALMMVLLLVIASGQARAAPALPPLTILCWHDVRDTLREPAGTPPQLDDNTAVGTRDLVAQLEMLRLLGFTPIRLQQWLDAQAGLAPLPDKPVLLTFDDGYASLYTHVFPLLRLYGYPAIAAVVAPWVNQPPPNGRVSWAQLREMVDSGLVEVASHSHDLHRYTPATTQGDRLPASASRRLADGGFESDTQFIARLRDDAVRSADEIEQQLGERPRAIVWPYGAYTAQALQAADQAGFVAAMNLDTGRNGPDQSPLQLRRYLVQSNTGLTDLARAVTTPLDNPLAGLGTLRTLRVTLDDVYDADPSQQEARLQALVQRVRQMGVNVVQLEAGYDADHDGRLDMAYFTGTRLPVRADLFARAALQLRSQTRARVFASLPISEPDAVFEDLVRAAPLAGLVFRDDLLPYQADARSPQATRQLTQRTVALVQRLRAWQPALISARQVSARSVISRLGEERHYETLAEHLAHYDLVVVNALPHQEESAMRNDRWLADLVGAVARQRGAIDRTLFEVHGPQLTQGVADLLATRARHIGYDGDQPARDWPPLQQMRPLISTATQQNRQRTP